jgi:hypothetical protein
MKSYVRKTAQNPQTLGTYQVYTPGRFINGAHAASVTAVWAPLVGSGRGIYNAMATQSATAAGGITRDNRHAAQIRYTAHGIGRCGRAGTGICK